MGTAVGSTAVGTTAARRYNGSAARRHGHAGQLVAPYNSSPRRRMGDGAAERLTS
ncbi:hypothetical protein [Lentzea flaviverrucosa]|uniref:hypothetical protein n=1 Tax=Lentzea flaviverrucosa TaxID=200379 RepID=UPI001476A174|nr:hypothetical protein [Lentzea flaviverrucosa]